MRLINLTPHPIHLHAPDGVIRTYMPEPTPARLAEVTEPTDTILDGAPVMRVAYTPMMRVPGTPEVHFAHGPAGLPPETEGVVYIVSQMVAAACPDRGDLVYPYGIVRDDSGSIVGCRGWAVPA